MPSFNDRPAKKQYETPKLFVFGDIKELTKTVGNSGNKDSGQGSTSKTMV